MKKYQIFNYLTDFTCFSLGFLDSFYSEEGEI